MSNSAIVTMVEKKKYKNFFNFYIIKGYFERRAIKATIGLLILTSVPIFISLDVDDPINKMNGTEIHLHHYSILFSLLLFVPAQFLLRLEEWTTNYKITDNTIHITRKKMGIYSQKNIYKFNDIVFIAKDNFHDQFLIIVKTKYFRRILRIYDYPDCHEKVINVILNVRPELKVVEYENFYTKKRIDIKKVL